MQINKDHNWFEKCQKLDGFLTARKYKEILCIPWKLIQSEGLDVTFNVHSRFFKFHFVGFPKLYIGYLWETHKNFYFMLNS